MAARPEQAIQSRLARVVGTFRARDWAGIAIEIAVVTLGVLLAFQIDQWAQDRRGAREERQFLERMWRESAEAVRENEWVVWLHAANRKAVIEGLRRRRDPEALARYSSGCGADSMPGIGFNDTGYAELSTSGRLNIISDPQLRFELRQVAAAQADAVAQLNYARQKSISIRQAVESYFTLDLDQGGRRTCRVDWPRLVEDQMAVNAMISAERHQLLMWWKRAYTRDLLARAHNRIACKLGKADCREIVPEIVGRRNYDDTLPPDLEQSFEKSAANPVIISQ